MKYTYAYKTSDGIRHEDSMNAASREEVFVELRKRGIKAIKVVAADGSKSNGEIRGVRKRVVVALVIVAALCVGVVAFLGGTRSTASTMRDSANEARDGASRANVVAHSSPRHQIYGDPAIIERFERGEFGNVLEREGDKLLAIFAQPGKLMCDKGVNTWKWGTKRGECGIVFEAYAKNELGSDKDIVIDANDTREAQELKAIINWMREEMREYLANGYGTPRSYWRRLNERTRTEIQIFERTKRELEKETKSEVWEEKNEALRCLGLRTIPYPNE